MGDTTSEFLSACDKFAPLARRSDRSDWFGFEPQGYGFNSNASMKFRVNDFISKSTVNPWLVASLDFPRSR
jgi:hypothetical protein